MHPFLQNFNEVSFACKLLMYRPKLKSVNLPVLEIIATEVLGALQSREGGHKWSGMAPSVRAFLLHSNVFSIFTRYRDIAAFVFHFSPAHLSLFKFLDMFPWD